MINASRCFAGSCVTNNGKIRPWGVVKILNIKRRNDGSANDIYELWSEKLLSFGRGEHFAEISILLPDVLLIYNKDTRVETTAIPVRELYIASTLFPSVIEGGFLILTPKERVLAKYLKQLIRGEDPNTVDPYPFLRVQDVFCRQRVALVDLSAKSNRTLESAEIRIYTLDGLPLEYRVSRPLIKECT